MLVVPGFLSLLLLALFTMKLHWLGVSLVPNVAWVMTLVAAAMMRAAWPLWLVFMLGLLQDVVFHTPLGSQAVLAVLLTELVRSQSARQQFQLFRVRWLEATAALIVWHLLLWLLMHGVVHGAPPLKQMLLAGLVDGIWFPLFYVSIRQLVRDGVHS